MSQAPENTYPPLPLQLNALELAGLRKPKDGEWPGLRALQYSNLAPTARMRAFGHIVAMCLALSTYAQQAPILHLVAWTVAIVATVWNRHRVERSLAFASARTIVRKGAKRHIWSVVALSLAWICAPLFIAPFGTETELLVLAILAAMLIAGSALTSVAPLNTIILSVIVGITMTGTLLFYGMWQVAFAMACFYSLLQFGALTSVKTFLTARIAEAGVAEKSETVSLLLREYEENEADWLWQVDTHRRVRAPSPRFAFALGQDPAKIEDESFIKLISGPSWDNGQFASSLRDLAERLKRRENFSNLIVQVEVGSGRRWWELSGTPMHDEEGNYTGFRGVGSDVTEQRESDEKIAYLARYDTLTGLPNRLMLTEALGEAMRYAKQWSTRCAFLMIDLDRFKQVNDSLGHQTGDKMLAQVSERLGEVISENELVGRLGGDEFAIVIRDASDRGAVARVAKKVITALSQPYEVDKNKLFIGASVGSAIGPRDGDSVEALMRSADLALYRAKDEGGGEHCVFEPELHAMAEERRQLETSLRHALEREEFKINLQPVVDANSEAVVSFEALLRWHSPEHGFVSPAKFIPLAEDTGLVVPIGAWVLEEACRQAATWPVDAKVAVNVSAEQLMESDFAETVVRALDLSKLPPRRLEVEVTESVFVRDGHIAKATLEEILALGCSIALDDFGTGYSSLGYLRELPFSTIKVDRSFVQGASQGSRESLAIINAVVAMASSLEMSTTAEGVETPAEAKMIRDLGCTKIQGYYYGRPMPVDEARALLANPRSLAKRDAA
ncbi:putative bifunctional diguanylate cyclase/phosphodiesterase [Paraurantiacibacter namhicola]|uniref:Cyclic di-GMP phosphodiesterase Gmr n=1 Tax=Paraurantiacibacter namhicola TaxID=645517 RepID=A0A1C7DAP8_9SPHN|nr:EAL domain-containing protein [Paraurantiacibacter namhicola]ANU08373.1 Cyclic di-GMP phosphodiesterase Gmr [Paraurantiacibacter namhicola]